MAEELPSKDFHHLTCSLVTEFGKNRCCCALSSEGKIHAVHQVHIHSDAVDDYIYPSSHTIVDGAILHVKGNQEHEQYEGIGIKYSGRVK